MKKNPIQIHPKTNEFISKVWRKLRHDNIIDDDIYYCRGYVRSYEGTVCFTVYNIAYDLGHDYRVTIELLNSVLSADSDKQRSLLNVIVYDILHAKDGIEGVIKKRNNAIKRIAFKMRNNSYFLWKNKCRWENFCLLRARSSNLSYPEDKIGLQRLMRSEDL